MDKASVALAATEDNAAAIRELTKSISRKTSCKILSGNTISTGGTKFGTVTSDGNAIVIIRFSGSTATLKFDGKQVTSMQSPMFAVLPAGSGELDLVEGRAFAYALIIGGA